MAAMQRPCAVPVTQPRPFLAASRVQGRRCTRQLQPVRAGESEADKAAAVQAAMQQAMSNPQVAAQMQAMEEAMKKPDAQAQMSQMMSVMGNPQFMQKMQQLKEDPELKPIFNEIKAGGMAAMMKYMNDPTFLAKIGEAMGDLDPAALADAAAAAPPPPPQAEPEINNVLDAAKYGDVEAVEDFCAISKADVRDAEGRSALHYAVAYNHPDVVQALLAGGADTAATEAQGNSALHYAAGYGRPECVQLLLAGGADVGARNGRGQTAAEVVREEERNPLNGEPAVMALLEGQELVQQ